MPSGNSRQAGLADAWSRPTVWTFHQSESSQSSDAIQSCALYAGTYTAYTSLVDMPQCSANRTGEAAYTAMHGKPQFT